MNQKEIDICQELLTDARRIRDYIKEHPEAEWIEGYAEDLVMRLEDLISNQPQIVAASIQINKERYNHGGRI